MRRYPAHRGLAVYRVSRPELPAQILRALALAIALPAVFCLILQLGGVL